MMDSRFPESPRRGSTLAPPNEADFLDHNALGRRIRFRIPYPVYGSLELKDNSCKERAVLGRSSTERYAVNHLHSGNSTDCSPGPHHYKGQGCHIQVASDL